jgi:hypothetical protein
MEAVDWLRFNPDKDAGELHIEILIGRLIELQPRTNDATDEFCQELYPVLDGLTQLCLEHNFKQVCSVNMDGIHVCRIRPMIMIRMIWNIYEHTKNCILLEKCEVAGGSPFFNTLVEAVRNLLPPFMRNMININSVSEQIEDEGSDPSDGGEL